MKKLILTLSIIVLFAGALLGQSVGVGTGFAQRGGSITGLSFDGEGIVFGSPADSVIFEIPVSLESSISITTLASTSFLSYDTDSDSIINKPSGFSITNSGAEGIYVWQYKDGEGPTSHATLDSLGNFIIGNDLDVVADLTAGTITSDAGVSGTTITGTGVGQFSNISFNEGNADNILIGVVAYPTIGVGADKTVAIGSNVARAAGTDMDQGVIIGYKAQDTGDGDFNVVIGYEAGKDADGSENVIIGQSAGVDADGSRNIFIGSGAGYSETGSDKLYIESTSSASPLIYGDFAADSLVFNAEVTIAEIMTLRPNVASNAGTSVADDGAITVTNTIMRVVGADADAVLDTNPAINDGSADGQTVTIQGTADGNLVTIADNVNTQLAGGVSMSLGDGDVICFMWDSNYSMWIEQYRSDN